MNAPARGKTTPASTAGSFAPTLHAEPTVVGVGLRPPHLNVLAELCGDQDAAERVTAAQLAALLPKLRATRYIDLVQDTFPDLDPEQCGKVGTAMALGEALDDWFTFGGADAALEAQAIDPNPATNPLFPVDIAPFRDEEGGYDWAEASFAAAQHWGERRVAAWHNAQIGLPHSKRA